ncbi:secreted RxLR effector protein 161-like [Cicer arietinum]|uniref:secreted RxLR effector protein 161-like n=1 Tax=Cicer arietinum TaxID=3827 RepID=UPI003CC56CDF
MEKPRAPHYLEETSEFDLLYLRSSNEREAELIGYIDVDWCGDKDDRKSTMGYVFMMNKTSISWCPKKQSIVALSTREVEYVAASMGVCQALWMAEMELRNEEVVKMVIDNKSAINLGKHPIVHGRSKHIETRFHFLRDQIVKDKLKLKHRSTNG